jgi:hypothetical protein
MKPHLLLARIFSCDVIFSNFNEFDFQLFYFNSILWNDSWISFVIQGYI